MYRYNAEYTALEEKVKYQMMNGCQFWIFYYQFHKEVPIPFYHISHTFKMS